MSLSYDIVLSDSTEQGSESDSVWDSADILQGSGSGRVQCKNSVTLK